MGRRRTEDVLDAGEPITTHVVLHTHERQPLLGHLTEHGIMLSPGGKAVARHLTDLPDHHEGVLVDSFIVMPDHIHVILLLGTDPFQRRFPDLSQVVNAFKHRVQQDWKAGTANKGWPPYENHLWQKAYRDTPIESQTELQEARRFLYENPQRTYARLHG